MADKLGVFWTVLPERVTYQAPGGGDGGGVIITPNPDGGSGGGGEVIITPNPDGGGENPPPPPVEQGTLRLRFSATVTFRLSSDRRPLFLNAFAPLEDWPELLRNMQWTAKFSSAPEATFTPTLLTDGIYSEAWKALFKPVTFVRAENPEDYDARDQKPIRSYPRREVNNFVRRLHVDAQQQSAKEDGTVVIRRPIRTTVLNQQFNAVSIARNNGTSTFNLRSYLENDVLRLQPARPDTWAISRNALTGLSGALKEAAEFVQLNRYYNRVAAANDDATPTAPPAVKNYDFHQLATLALLQPPVGRAIGVILDFEMDVPESLVGDGEMQLIADYDAPGVERNDVFYKTAYHLEKTLFEIRAENANFDANGQYLLLGNGNFDIEDGLDVDSAALKTRESEQVYADAPEPSDLAALRTTGLAINRVDNATKLAELRKRDRKRFNAAYGSTADVKLTTLNASSPTVSDPPYVNYAEDLVRGFRFDVYDVKRGRWFSLHRRSGAYLVGRGDDEFLVEVLNDRRGEGFSLAAAPMRPKAARAGQADPDDEYYLSESVMRWGGWSLSVPRVGVPIKNGDELMPRHPTTKKPVFERPAGSLGLVVAQMEHAHQLPRLRFGRDYRFRARVVDAAGNSVPFSNNAEPESLGNAVSDIVTFRRFDPLESPTLVFRHDRLPGEGVHELVVRSEDATSVAAGTSQRLVPPPPTSQWIAECHGMFDDAIDNGDAAAIAKYQLLADREGLDWRASPFAETLAGGDPDEFQIGVQDDGDLIVVPYLPDPGAKFASVQNLPSSPGFELLTFKHENWPNMEPARLILRAGQALIGPGSSDVAGRGQTVVVTLGKGDVRDINIASAPAPEPEFPGSPYHFGLAKLTLDKLLSDDSIDQGFVRLQFPDSVLKGFHRAISPPQSVRLVHAVRKPLRAPTFDGRNQPQDPDGLSIGRLIGATQASVSGGLGYSPRSTGRLDIRATWHDYRDTGPGGVNPTIPIPRAAQVYGRELNRDEVPAGLDVDYDRHLIAGGVVAFGDTHHYKTTFFPKATTAFLKYFRETVEIDFSTLTEIITSDEISEAPIHVVGKNSGNRYSEGPDYRINREERTIRKVGGSAINEPVNVSFIPGVIDWENDGREMHVRASARPTPPIVHSLVPTFRWQRQVAPAAGPFPRRVQSIRSGGGLRVWLERPWWSSGEDEQLGVVVEPLAVPLNDDPEKQKYYSQAGTDPGTDSLNTRRFLKQTDFSGGNDAVNVSLADNGRIVTVVPYTVQFDVERDQWFADIFVTPHADDTVGHFPFVKLTLVRYQPHALLAAEVVPGTSTQQTLNLSSAVFPDWVQVAPQRDVWVSRKNNTLTIDVFGHSYLRMQDESNPLQKPTGRGPTRMMATLQRRNTTYTDELLGWENVPVANNAIVSAIRTTELAVAGPPVDRTHFRWTGTLTIPSTTVLEKAYTYRVLVEEFELHYADTDTTASGIPIIDAVAGGQIEVNNTKERVASGLRCVFQDMITLDGL